MLTPHSLPIALQMRWRRSWLETFVSDGQLAPAAAHNITFSVDLCSYLEVKQLSRISCMLHAAKQQALPACSQSSCLTFQDVCGMQLVSCELQSTYVVQNPGSARGINAGTHFVRL